MRFHLLGPVEVIATDGTAVTLPGARARAILAMLLIARSGMVTRDALYETGSTAKDPVSALYVQIAKLRAALPGTRIESTPGGYRLQVSPGSVDADEFIRAVARGRAMLRAGEHVAAAHVLRAALSWWRASRCEAQRFAARTALPLREGEAPDETLTEFAF